MSRPYLKLLLTVLIGLGLAACSDNPNDVNDDAPLYVPSTDTHPCLGVAVAAPGVIGLGTETTVRVDVHNRCDETTTYESSGPPYSLALVHDDNQVAWYTPSEPVPDILLEYTVEANGTTSYDVPVPLSADSVLPGTYRIIANLFVGQMEPDATQYVEDLRLESELQSVDTE